MGLFDMTGKYPEPYMEKRQDAIEEAAWKAASLVRDSLASGGSESSPEWVQHNIGRVLGAYREIHALYGRGSDFPERVITCEKLLCLGLNAAGVRARYRDNLSDAAGTSVPEVEPWGSDLSPQQAAQVCTEIRGLAPDCIMVQPGDVEVLAGIGPEGPAEPAQMWATTQAGRIIGGAYLQALLPPGLISADMFDPGAGNNSAMAAVLPLYDLALVRRGALRQSGIGAWEMGYGDPERADIAQVAFLDYKPGMTVSGAKHSGVQATEFTVPFDVVGSQNGDDLDTASRQMLQRIVAGSKKAGDKIDPEGRVPYGMDGEFPLHHILTGVVLEPEVPDRSKSFDPATGEKMSDHDVYDEDHIRMSMWWYMANAAGRMTFMHTEHGGKEVTSECPILAIWQQYPERKYMQPDGTERVIRAGTWMQTVWVKSEALWSAYIKGLFNGFSIGYYALGEIQKAV